MPDLSGSPGDAARLHKRSLRVRAIHELREFAAMFLYLLLPLSLFVFHRGLALNEKGADYQFTGVALVNALVLAKVMLVAEDLGLGKRWRSRPLIWPILAKSILFAGLLLLVHAIEEGLRGVIHGKGFIESVPDLGGSGGPVGLLLLALNIAIALVPFFAYRELGRVMGLGELEALLFRPRPD